MNKINKGGPAFPAGEMYEIKEGWRTEPGMSLRDWFAGQALAGNLASYGGFTNHPDPQKAAARAYAFADAMLAEREKGGAV